VSFGYDAPTRPSFILLIKLRVKVSKITRHVTQTAVLRLEKLRSTNKHLAYKDGPCEQVDLHSSSSSYS
jgi:hypothetical protein